jgi:hypothetical protein
MNIPTPQEQFARAKALRAKFFPTQTRPVVIRQAVPKPEPVVHPPIAIDPNEAEWNKRKEEADEAVAKGRGRISAKFLVAAFAAERGIEYADLTGPSQLMPLVHQRQDCWAELKRLRPDLTLQAIAKMFDDRDHTTVMYGIRQSKRRNAR